MRTEGDRVSLKYRKLVILLLDDNPDDVFFLQRALEQVDAGHILRAVANGEEAVLYVRGEGQFAERGQFPVPNIILTDIKMPRMGGFEFLQWLRKHPECSVIPTIVMSSSAQETDVRKAYQLGANAYIRKPSNLGDLVKLIRVTYEYWSLCERPPLVQKC